jgi:hypothetical protein
MTRRALYLIKKGLHIVSRKLKTSDDNAGNGNSPPTSPKASALFPQVYNLIE